MVSPYQAEHTKDGWVIADGIETREGFATKEAAVEAARILNAAGRSENVGNGRVNRQGGVELSPAQHQVAPLISRGDRRSEVRVVADAEQGEKVSHLVPPDQPLPPQMVSPTRGSEPDDAIGDVLVSPNSAVESSVWEAIEGQGSERRSDEAQARADAGERAAVPTDIGPADTEDSRGGGPGGR